MKLILVLSLGLLVTVTTARIVPKETCVPGGNCVLPDCVCSNIDHPAMDQFPADEAPQMVFLTFDDGITVENYPFYQQLFNNPNKPRVNPNGAPITGTFFVTHEYNDYTLTHQLYRQGQEIALHSITHKSNVTYWKELPTDGWVKEVVDQRQQMAKFANLPESELIGFRAPFLQGGGDAMYDAIAMDPVNGIKYDSSRPTWRLRPLLWPYTAEFDTLQDCQIEPCPTKSYPKFWVPPLVDLLGDNGQPCAMIDTCLPTPESAEEAYQLLMRNFLEHYTQTRAPFGVYTHAAWLLHPDRKFMVEGYERFVDEILDQSKFTDVYIVSIKKALDWMQTPTSKYDIDNLSSWGPPPAIDDDCTRPQNCVYDVPDMGERLMNICSFPCPPNYPWLDNPLGA